MRLQKGGRDPIRQKLAPTASSSHSVEADPLSVASSPAGLPSREFVEIGPEVLDRMQLEREPSAATVESYVLTHGASRAWQAINAQLTAPRGALFWIGGAAGAGKTHFLNYVLALSARAGSLSTETARYLTLPVEVSGRASAAEIDRRILDSIATALGGDDPAPALWRQLRGAEGLTIAFDRARRQGVKGVTIAIDLGLDQSAAAVNTLSALAELGRGIKQLRLIVAAAGRGDPPAQAQAFNVTPHADEELGVAVGRARRLHDSALRTVEGLYGKLESAWDTRAIYPFHPAAASTLRSLYGTSLFDSGATIGTLAKAVREVIEPWYRDRDFQRLVMPAALMRSPTVRRTLDTELGEAGRAALKIANAAAVSEALDDRAHDLLQALVDTLVLLHIGGSPAMLPVTGIRERMDLVGLNGVDRDRLTNALIALAENTRGVIVYDSRAQSAGFNPRGAGAPQVAAFNSALALLTRFDPSLKAAQELPDLNAKRKRLAIAMTTAIEDACSNRESLAAALRERGARLSLDQEQAFDRFIELAEGGVAALIDAGADPQRRATALAAVAAYEPLAIIADSLPRFRTMRNYLAATGLLPGYVEPTDRASSAGAGSSWNDDPPGGDSHQSDSRLADSPASTSRNGNSPAFNSRDGDSPAFDSHESDPRQDPSRSNDAPDGASPASNSPESDPPQDFSCTDDPPDRVPPAFDSPESDSHQGSSRTDDPRREANSLSSNLGIREDLHRDGYSPAFNSGGGDSRDADPRDFDSHESNSHRRTSGGDESGTRDDAHHDADSHSDDAHGFEPRGGDSHQSDSRPRSSRVDSSRNRDDAHRSANLHSDALRGGNETDCEGGSPHGSSSEGHSFGGDSRGYVPRNDDDAHRTSNSSGESRELYSRKDDSRVADASDLEIECQLLIVALNPVVRSNAGRNLAAIEDRFQTFKATYVQRYRSSHDRHRSALEALAPVADDARRQLEALRRLNAIVALGPPAGPELGPAMATLERRLAPCNLTEALTPEVTPCCPHCGFLLGTPSPDKELGNLADRVRRALQTKLAALSHNAVARLIREHDRNHRLEGFLKIVQAAQTDSLVRILDDELARYLAQLLSENPAAPPAPRR